LNQNKIVSGTDTAEQETIVKPGGKLSRWFLAQLIFSTVKIEAICSSETSVDTQRTTRRYDPEDGTLNVSQYLHTGDYVEHIEIFFCRRVAWRDAPSELF
jgi:hypothetical protein